MARKECFQTTLLKYVYTNELHLEGLHKTSKTAPLWELIL